MSFFITYNFDFIFCEMEAITPVSYGDKEEYKCFEKHRERTL